MPVFIEEFDKAVINFIHSNLQHDTVSKVMSFISLISENGLIWILLISILFLSKKHRKLACVTAMSFLLCRLIGVQILKPLISRPRPFLDMQHLDIYIPKPTSYSFPSGHAISSFSTAWVLLNMVDKLHLKILLIIAAVVISTSRLYLMVHYPSDVLAGIFLGILSSHLALHTFKDFR